MLRTVRSWLSTVFAQKLDSKAAGQAALPNSSSLIAQAARERSQTTIAASRWFPKFAGSASSESEEEPTTRSARSPSEAYSPAQRRSGRIAPPCPCPHQRAVSGCNTAPTRACTMASNRAFQMLAASSSELEVASQPPIHIAPDLLGPYFEARERHVCVTNTSICLASSSTPSLEGKLLHQLSVELKSRQVACVCVLHCHSLGHNHPRVAFSCWSSAACGATLVFLGVVGPNTIRPRPASKDSSCSTSAFASFKVGLRTCSTVHPG